MSEAKTQLDDSVNPFEPQQRFFEVIRRDGRYPPGAYEFLHRALFFTTHRIHGQPGEKASRHVSGRQLCEGARDLAIQSWGPLAGTVLGRWNIRCTRDLGEMVFLLVNAQFMGKQENDRVEDFEAVFDFQQAFAEYEIPTGQGRLE